MLQTFPLTHFEELMLHQDSPSVPTNCFVRMRFQGRLDERAFRAAARATLIRHPLLHATVQPHRGRYRWQVDEPAPHVIWSCDDTSSEHTSSEHTSYEHTSYEHTSYEHTSYEHTSRGDRAGRPRFRRLNLEVEHGLRFAVHLAQGASEVMVQFHHACCDGLAIFQVLHELLLAYTMEVDANADFPLPEVDQSLLANRGSLGLTVSSFLRLAPRQAVGLRGVWQFLTRNPQHLVPHRAAERTDPTPPSFPSVVAHHFDPQETAAVRQAAKAARVTQNDLLISDLFLALDAFRRAQNVGDPKGWLRVMIPVSLRRKQQYQAPAANIVSSVFLDRRRIDMQQPDRLRKEISEEMTLIKRLQLNYLFVYSLWAQRLLPRGLQRTARPKRCQTTAVFTNLSRLFARSPLPRSAGRLKCGNVILEATEAIPPIARHLSAAFGVSWYANRLTIALHHDPRAISEQAAAVLLEMFVRRIRESSERQ